MFKIVYKIEGAKCVNCGSDENVVGFVHESKIDDPERARNDIAHCMCQACNAIASCHPVNDDICINWLPCGGGIVKGDCIKEA